MAPMPPVAKITASAAWVVTSMERRSMEQMPRQTPDSSMTAERKVEAFKFFDAAFGFVPADLFVESVEQLLAGGGARESGAVVQRAAETAIVEQAFGSAIEHHAHTIKQVDDAGGGFAHALERAADWRGSRRRRWCRRNAWRCCRLRLFDFLRR